MVFCYTSLGNSFPEGAETALEAGERGSLDENNATEMYFRNNDLVIII